MITRKIEQSFESGKPPAAPGQHPHGRGTYDDKLNRILEAATVLIARTGYEKASMRAVAQASGVSLAGLYHYFDSKEKMLFLIQFRAFNSLLMTLREKLHGVTDPVERLRVLIRVHVSYFAANMPELRVCSHELDSLSGSAFEETRRIRREYYKVAKSIIHNIIDRRAPGSGLDPHVATMLLFSMLNWLYRWYNPEDGRSPTALSNQIVGQFLDGMLGSGSAQHRSSPSSD